MDTKKSKPVPTAAANYPEGEPKLPKHFSFISAQTGPSHDEPAHRRLKKRLGDHGYAPVETIGNWHYPERSLLVPHGGTEQDHKTIEGLGFQEFKQDSVLHHSNGVNRLVNSNGQADWVGQGYTHGADFKESYMVLPSGHKIRMNLRIPESILKAEPKKDGEVVEHKKPHYYGDIENVHIFHATDDSHQDLIGEHIHNPSNDELKTALSEAKKKKMPVVVIHGSPPESLMTRLHPTLGAHMPGKVLKSELAKNMLHRDKHTMTNPTDNAQMMMALPEKLKQWGAEKIAPMPNDGIEEYEIDGRKIKVRKHDADLYSGALVDKDGTQLHTFDHISYAELLSHILAKLELYGKEISVAKDSDVVEIPRKDLIDEHKKLVHALATDDSKEIADELKEQGSELIEQQSKEESKPAITNNLKAKLEKLREMVRERLGEVEKPADEQVVIPTKDMAEGLLDPEEACGDCGEENCVCYENLPRPVIQLDMKNKRVTILFKSEWSAEDKESFLDDLKRRAGRIIKRRESV